MRVNRAFDARPFAVLDGVFADRFSWSL